MYPLFNELKIVTRLDNVTNRTILLNNTKICDIPQVTYKGLRDYKYLNYESKELYEEIDEETDEEAVKDTDENTWKDSDEKQYVLSKEGLPLPITTPAKREKMTKFSKILCFITLILLMDVVRKTTCNN